MYTVKYIHSQFMDILEQMGALVIMQQYQLDTFPAVSSDDIKMYINMINIMGYVHLICREDRSNEFNTRNLFELIKGPDDVRVCECGATFREICPHCNIRNTIIHTEVLQTSAAPRDPCKQFNKCLSAIQGINLKEIPQEHIQQIARACATEKRDGLMHIDVMRSTLRLLKMSKYYPESAFIIRAIYGTPIYQLSSEEKAFITSRFMLIRQTLATMKDRGSNIEGNGYYIYKTIEGEYPVGSGPRSLLRYIHLKDDRSLKKDDAIYERVCEIRGPPFIYKPTTRVR